MKSNIFTLFLAILFTGSLFGNNINNLIPLNYDILGIKFDKLKKKHPNIKTVFLKKGTNDKVESGIIYLKIEKNIFWDSAIIKIVSGKVFTCSFVKTKNFTQAIENVPTIIRLLIKKYGEKYLKEINNVLNKKGNVDGPLLVWKKQNAIFAFTCSPLDKEYRIDDIFCCQLTMLSKDAKLTKEFQIKKKSKGKIEKVFRRVKYFTRISEKVE